MKNKSIEKNVFTLIELLVVIAIIAILAAMLLSALKNARDMAKRTVCIGNLKQCGTVLLVYSDDFNGRIMIQNKSEGWVGWVHYVTTPPYQANPTPHRAWNT